MKTLQITLAELKFVFRQGLTALLIMAYPMLILALLAPAFTGTDTAPVKIAIHAADGQAISELSSLTGIEAAYMNSAGAVKTAVKNGGYAAGFDVGRVGNRTVIYVYSDPLREMLAKRAIMSIQESFSDKAAEIIIHNASAVFTGLGENIDTALENINSTRESVKNMRERIGTMTTMLKAVEPAATGTDALDIGRTIGSMGTKLDSLRTTLDRFADSIGSFDEIDSNLADTGERLGKTRAKLEKYDKTLGDLITVIDDKIERMDQADSELTRQENSLYATPGIELVPDEYRAGASEAFDTTHGELSQMRSDLVKTRDDLESAMESLKGLQADLEGMNSTLARMRAGLKEDGAYASSVQAQARAQLKDMRAGIFRADAALPGAADSIQSSTEFLAYSKETFPEITAAVDGQDDRMENYETLLSSASGSIGQLNKIDPETLAVPRISMMPTTPTSRYFDMLFPAIIGVISLFGCLLLPMIIRMRQREQGMELRLQLTTASTLAKVVGQYLSYTVIGMAQISIFALIGIAAYGVEIYGSWKLFLATLVLAPALFTAIGMLCASIVNRGSTAVLLTLLLGVPMLFLSGALIPLEFISEPFSTLGMLTPLYQVIELLGMAVLRGIAPAALGAALVIAVAFIVISLGAAYYIERKRACTG